MFSTLSKTGIIILATLNLSSANVWNLDQSKILLFGKEFKELGNSLPHNQDFQHPCLRSLLKTLQEKEEMLVTSIFSFSNSVFYPFPKRFVFKLDLFCLQLLSIWTSLKICHLVMDQLFPK